MMKTGQKTKMSSNLTYFSKSHLPIIVSEQIIQKKENSIYNLAIIYCVLISKKATWTLMFISKLFNRLLAKWSKL